MNKKLTLILLTNLVISGPMITDVSTSVDPRSLMPQTTTSSSSSGFSLAEKMEQLKQQVLENILAR